MALGDIAMVGLNFGLILFVVIFGTGVCVAAYFIYQNWKKYQEYICNVYERDGTGHWRKKTDMAGVFVDRRTNNKRFFMKRANVGLSPDNIPYVTREDGKKEVNLLRLGLKNFVYININFDKELDSMRMTVGEEDVNWAINAYERQKKAFGQDKLLQYLPFILLAFVSIIILIIFIYFFKDFGVLKDVATAFQGAAQAYAQAHAGTVVLPAA